MYFFRVDGHEIFSSPFEQLVSRKLECRKNIAITYIRHMNSREREEERERERERARER